MSCTPYRSIPVFDLRSGLLLFLAIIFALQPAKGRAAVPVQADDVEELVYDVEVNAQPTSEMLIVLRDGQGGFWLEESDFSRLRMRVPPSAGRLHEGRRYVALTAIVGAVAALDQGRQRLILTVPPESFQTTRLGLTPRSAPVLSSGGMGAFLNYQVTAQRVDNENFGGGFAELGLFTPKGVLVQTGVARANPQETRTVRLDTAYTLDFPERMQRLSVGDAISDGGVWGSSVRFGGIGWGKNFSLRPDLLTTPLLSASGNAVVPSTVDVYVNNQRVSSESLPPGPFVIDRLPSVTGAGQVNVVVRDELGREQQLTSPFYSSARLLAPELSQYQVDLGSIRRDYAIASSHYGDLLASGTYRRGLTNALTIEAHGEYLQSLAQAGGITLAAALAQFGVLNLTAAGGGGEGESGSLVAAGIERQSMRFNWALSSAYASKGYRQIATAENPTLQFRRRNLVQAGTNFHQYGSVALAFVSQRYVDRDNEQTMSFSYSKSVMQQGAVNLTATRTTQRGEEAYGAYLTFTLALGPRTSVSMSASGGSGPGSPDDELYAAYMKNSPVGTGQGYRMSASTAGNYDAQWRNQTTFGDLALGAARYSGVSGLSADFSGAATLLGGQLRSARLLSNSFALVNVGGLAEVPIYLDNQLVARTDADGWAMLHDLRAYEPNRISVHPDEVPLDTSIGSRLLVISPTYRSGVLAKFPVERIRSGTFRLLMRDGNPVPAGAVVRFKGQTFPVAYDGVTYVTGFDHGMAGDASWEGNRCVFRLDPPPPDDVLPDMGTIVCSAAALRDGSP